MALKLYKPITAGLRFASTIDYSDITKKRPEKRLRSILSKNSGRNSTGKVTVRHQGGRAISSNSESEVSAGYRHR